MRCLYCGKELALLKRWTRGGQFCSEAHKKSYQEEYNRIGLSRLLQAQSKPKASQQEAAPASGGGSKAPSRPDHAAPVAVEEEPVEVPAENHREEIAAETAQETVEAPADAVAEAAAREVSDEIAEDPAEEPAETAWEPDNMAGFINESAPQPVALEFSPYSASWQAAELPPASPQWQSQGVLHQHLPEAAVLELKFRPNLAESEYSAPEVKLSPNEFEPGKPFPPALGPVLASNQLPSAGVRKLDMMPRTVEWSALESTGQILSFLREAPQQEWTLLQLRCTDIALPGADAPVFFEGESADDALWGASKDSAGIPEPEDAESEQIEALIEPDAETSEMVTETPAATEGLAQLSDAVTEDQGGSRESAPEEEVEPQAVVEEPVAVEEPVHEPLALEEQPAEEEPAAAEPVAGPPQEPRALRTPTPRSADQAVDIPLKIFTPAKPSPVEGAGALIKLPVFLPGHTGLPLRPKMGLVPASGAGSKKSAQRPVVQPPESKAAESKPEAKQETAKQEPKASAVEKAPETPKAEVPKTAAVPNAKPWGKPTAPPSPKDGKGRPVAAKVQPSVKITPPAAKPREEEKSKAPAAEKTTVEKLAVEKPPVEKVGAEKAAEPKAKAARAAAEPESAPIEIEAPHFGAQDRNTSFLSTLKGKLAIGGVAAVLCLSGYFVFGGKSPAPAPNPAAAADKAGPSIMVGGGGWVEGWSGDPNGAHFGRQITIYRPSLKLSDYRMEFKGEIEHKSLGWVFRATDPQNYYAMKLAITTPGLEPKISLVKSVVSEGKETQAGKTALNLSVRLDTQYSVRVDVRGSKFTTYVQGQQVDTWNDDQLKVGGAGFLNEREERGRIKSVSVSLLNGGKQ